MERSVEKLNKRKSIQAIFSVLPVVIIILAIRAYPIIVSIIRSFTNWDGMYKSDFVGLKNYRDLILDSNFWLMLQNNAIFLFNVVFQVIFGLIVAILLYEEVFGWKFFRSLFYVPQLISGVILGYLFSTFFGFNGPFNTLLRAIGLDTIAVDWMADRKTSLPVIIFSLVWQSIGWQALVVLGGLSSISPNIFEAAIIDGANFLKRTVFVVIPMLVRVIEYSIIMAVVWTFTGGLFPFIFSMTNGGPGYETTTLDYMIYLKGFVTGNKLGQSSALAVILLVFVLALTLVSMKAANRADNWGD